MRVIRVVLLIAAACLFFGRPAQAACHAFYFGEDPSETVKLSVAEGSSISLVVSRDGAVNASSVRVATANGSASTPSDYAKFDSRVTFTAETKKTINIKSN